MSNSTSGVTLPPGYLPPFSVVTDQDHSAWIIIATALGLACILVFVCARVAVRYSMISQFGQDDWLLASSVLMTIIQFAVVLYGCSVGLGKSMKDMSSPQQIHIQKISYTSNLLWIIAIALSKISVASLLRRIDAFGRRQLIFNVITGCLVTWAIASFFALALQCNLSHPWITLNEQCPNSFVRWKAISAFDILTELLLFASAIYLVWEVQTTTSRKVSILTGFSCRLLIIVPIGFRLSAFDSVGLTSDPSLREVVFGVWTQTQLSTAIICATIPSLLQFMRDLNTSFGGIKEHGNTTYGSQQRSQRSFPMSVLRSVSKMNASSTESQKAEEEELTNYEDHPVPSVNQTDLTSHNSTASHNSQKMIIQKDVTYSVEYA